MNFKNWVKSWGVIGWAIFIFALLSSYMIYVYFDAFHDGYSDDFNKWGAFGSYFASITGLFAFLGVLYTVKQSNEQAKANEDRGIFFTMLDLYQKKADAVTYKKETGINVFKKIILEMTNRIIIYSIYNEILTNDNFDFSSDPIIYELELKIAESMGTPPINRTFELTINEKEIIINKMKDSIRFQLEYNELKEPTIYINNFEYYFTFSLDLMKFENSKGVLDVYNYKLMRKIADITYKENEQYLGQYFRNIYYLMDMISKFKEKEKYSKIFRAQLSKSELILLLYNAVSSQSSHRTVKLLIENDIFNNIESRDVILYDMQRSLRNIDIKNFISLLFQQYQNDINNVK